LGTGDVAILGRDVIHSVVNPLARISGAIDVYDGEFLSVERSMWDAETLMEKPYDINAVVRGMPLQDAREGGGGAPPRRSHHGQGPSETL
jgi:predicted metal-dependent enzyme (double-stranded beta helix superfamily)